MMYIANLGALSDEKLMQDSGVWPQLPPNLASDPEYSLPLGAAADGAGVLQFRALADCGVAVEALQH